MCTKSIQRLSGFVVAVGFVIVSATAFAQDDGGGERSKFYNFDDMLVDGQLKKPEMMTDDARGQAKFERLLELKKSFMPKIDESTEEAALQ